jgi:hypothetical protein
MRYRLIRFSKTNEVVLDVQCQAPNQFGDNELFIQETGGSAVLYDYSEKQWYEPNQDTSKRFTTWWRYPQGKELPGYVKMIQLIGKV